MSKYRVVDRKVVEISTNFTIKRCDSKSKAIALSNFLNSGGAFDGFTPNFFLIPTLNLVKA
jgi:hypothetical protein